MSKNKLAHYGDTKVISLEEERTLKVVVTAPTLDRDLEVLDTKSARVPVKPQGWKYAEDLTLSDDVDIPFILDHDQWNGIQKMAGSVKKMVINEAGELEALVKLSTVDNGERVYTLAKEGHLGNSFSIGFTYQNATDDGESIKNYEILELSAVFKGSNRNARIMDVKSAGGSMTELEKKKAEAEALQKEIAEMEKKDAKDEKPETPETPEVKPAETTPVVEVEVSDEDVSEAVKSSITDISVDADGKVVATYDKEKVVDKIVSKVKETKPMNKDIAAEQVKDKATPSQVEVETKTISKQEARKMIVNAFGAIYSKDEKAFADIEEKMTGVKVINGTSGDPLFVPEVLASDIRDQYEITGNVGSLVNRIDIEGAETFRQLVETAGVGFQPVALGAVKPEDQPVWTSVVFEPFEWALIVAWLDGVQKRSPIAVYNQIVRYIAKEYRKLEDKIILTNPRRTVGSEVRSATGLIPILSTSGRNDNVQSYAAGDVLPALAKAWGAIESDEPITLVASRKTWASLAVTMDANKNPIFTVVGQQVTVGALGSFNVVLSQEAGDGEVVIGAFSDYNLVTRGGLGTLFSREATVGSLNLFTQDASALRADVDITGGPVMIKSFYLLDFGVASSS